MISRLIGVFPHRLNLYVNGVFMGNFQSGVRDKGINRFIRACLSDNARIVREDSLNIFMVDEETTFG